MAGPFRLPGFLCRQNNHFTLERIITRFTSASILSEQMAVPGCCFFYVLEHGQSCWWHHLPHSFITLRWF